MANRFVWGRKEDEAGWALKHRRSFGFQAVEQPKPDYIVGPFGEHETAEEIAAREEREAKWREIRRAHVPSRATAGGIVLPPERPDACSLAIKLRELAVELYGLSDENRRALHDAADLLEEQADNLEDL